jgi:hypothetical protein
MKYKDLIIVVNSSCKLNTNHRNLEISGKKILISKNLTQFQYIKV